MKENGKMTKLMVKVFIPTWMELDILDHGSKINNMDKESKLGPIMLIMKDHMTWVKNTVMENSIGLTDLYMMVNSKKIIFTEKVFTNGLMEENTMETGKITKWTVMENSLGLMEEDTLENTKMIRNKDMEFSNGLMVVNTKEAG